VEGTPTNVAGSWRLLNNCGFYAKLSGNPRGKPGNVGVGSWVPLISRGVGSEGIGL